MRLGGRRGPGSLRRVLAGLVAGLAVVLGVLIAVAIIGILSTAGDYRDGGEQARARQQIANQLLTDLLSAQSANRAYILLPSGDNLSEYQAARDRYPGEMAELRERISGEPDLEASADAVDRTAQLWFSEAVELIRLRRQGREEEAIQRINQGLSEGRFTAFQAEHNQLLAQI
jgi:CHASE3 domain sensor protein